MSATLPPPYIEKHPSRGRRHEPAKAPLECETVQILLPDGATNHATWIIGIWSGHGEQRPIG